MEEDSYEFVPKNWLMAWLADPQTVGAVETKHYLCVHENLDIDSLGDMKLCDTTGVNMLISEYGEGEGPRLTGVSSSSKQGYIFCFEINSSTPPPYIFLVPCFCVCYGPMRALPRPTLIIVIITVCVHHTGFLEV